MLLDPPGLAGDPAVAKAVLSALCGAPTVDRGNTSGEHHADKLSHKLKALPLTGLLAPDTCPWWAKAWVACFVRETH